MSYTQKVDVLDLLIKVLEEHEKKLDELISRLESQVQKRNPVDDTENMIRYYRRDWWEH